MPNSVCRCASNDRQWEVCVSDRVSCACVGGVVDPQVELRVKLVLHHSPVAHQTATGQLLQGCGIQEGDLLRRVEGLRPVEGEDTYRPSYLITSESILVQVV